jgi:hypothetical protein
MQILYTKVVYMASLSTDLAAGIGATSVAAVEATLTALANAPGLQSQFLEDSRAQKVWKVVAEYLEVVGEVIEERNRTPTAADSYDRSFQQQRHSTVADRALGVLQGISALQSLGGAIKDVATKETLKEKVKAVATAIFSSADVAVAACDSAALLATLHVISESSADWTQLVGVILQPLQAISTAQSVYDLVQLGRVANQVGNLPMWQGSPEDEQAAEQVGKAMRMLVADIDEAKLKKRLSLHPRTEIKGKAERIIQQLASVNRIERIAAVQEGTALVGELKKKARKEVAVSIFKTALKIVGLALTIAALCTPVGQIALGLAAAIALVGVGITIYRRYQSQKSPSNTPLVTE